MYIINSNFSFFKQIGNISGETIELLKKTFSNYPEIIIEQGEPVVFKKGLNALVIQGDVFSFVTQGEPDEINTKKLVDELIKLNSALNLPLDSYFSLRFEAVKNYDVNIMKKSTEKFQNAVTTLSAVGVGQRFIVNNEKFHGDVYIEPYVKDNNRVFFNVMLQSRHAINIIDSHEFLNELFNFAVTNAEEVADELYKK